MTNLKIRMKSGFKGIRRDACAILALVVVSVGLGIFARAGRDGQSAIAATALQHPVLTLGEFRAFVESRRVPILDARTQEAYREGHVPGALCLPSADFEEAYARLQPSLPTDKESFLVVYCADMWCGLGDELQQKLITRGYRHVGQFPDGWTAWVAAGLPSEKAP
jgi:rhodanese-related sulfurtransferase